MATVYSLICWGGANGKGVTIPAANTVRTSASHGVRTATCLQFTSGSSLPTPLALNTKYYAKVIDADDFGLYPTAQDATDGTNQITFGTGGTSLIMKWDGVINPGDYFAGQADLTRWGSGTYVFDGIASWNSYHTSTSPASSLDTHYAEIGMAFTEFRSGSALTITVPSAQNTIATYVDGVRSPAFANGAVSTASTYHGYVAEINGSLGGGDGIRLSRYGDLIDGITVRQTISYGVGSLISLSVSGTKGNNNILIGYSTSSPTAVLSVVGTLAEAYNNMIEYGVAGISINNYMYGCRVVGNSVTRAATGMYGSTQLRGYYYNNVSLGNTTNWNATTTYIEGASNNAGGTGEAWAVGSGTRVEITEASPFTATFTDWTNHDYSPAGDSVAHTSGSQLTDAGVEVYGAPAYDVAGGVRPSYKNGSATTYDIGAYEFDWGYGAWPAKATIALTNIVSGSRVLITRNDTSAVLYNDVPGTSLSFSTSYIGDFSVIIRKASASPYYLEFAAGGTTVADQTTTIKVLQQLDE